MKVPEVSLWDFFLEGTSFLVKLNRKKGKNRDSCTKVEKSIKSGNLGWKFFENVIEYNSE